MRAFLEVQAAQRHRPVRVVDGRVELLALRVDDHHAFVGRSGVQVAVERDLHRVRLNVDADDLGALAELVVGAGGGLVDHELLGR